MTKSAFIFIAGAAAGFFAACYLLRSKYETIAQDEINSVKETFSNREQKTTEKEDMSFEQYEDILQKEKYVPEEKQKPYVIPPEEFGDLEDYTIISLILFADGILTDEDYDKVDNVDDIIGMDALNHFGEYENDSVFVRNDKTGCYYEILKDHRKYSDVLMTVPHSMEEE